MKTLEKIMTAELKLKYKITNLLIKNTRDPITSIVDTSNPSLLNNTKDPSFFL